MSRMADKQSLRPNLERSETIRCFAALLFGYLLSAAHPAGLGISGISSAMTLIAVP